MKSKLFLLLVAVVGISSATSCLKDGSVEQSGNETQVTFSIGLESGMNTRAISDGSAINTIHYAIFDSNGDVVESSKDAEAAFPFDAKISLVKGKQYTAVFWAQNKDCAAYTLSDDMKSINVNYTDALNNDETRDAFFRSETFTVDENTNLNLVLKRPFVQLNVGITKDEWEKAEKQGIVIEKSEVTIKQAATTLSLIDGSVSGPMDVTFSSNAVPAESLLIDVDCDGVKETYKYLSMSYFLANDANGGSSKTTLSDLAFKFFLKDSAKEVIFEKGLENAPVQRNHRTNILTSGDNGGILTDIVSVNVMLDPIYDGEHTYTDAEVWEEHKGVYTEEALAGLTIEIPSDWNIRNGYILEPMPENWNTIPSPSPIYEKPYTIDGKGYTVTFEPYSKEFVSKIAFAAKGGALVTVKNINFEGEHFGIFGGVYGAKDYKTLFENINVINNGIYYYNSVGDIPISAFSNLGEATLNNCEITGTYWVGTEKDANVNAQTAIDNFLGVYDIFVPNDGVTTINNSTIGSIYINNHGVLTISGTSDTEKSEIGKIISKQLVHGTITIGEYANVESMDINQFSDTYPPKVNIKANATVGTLQLNSIKKTKIVIEAGATVGKIIWKGVEYTSVGDFNAAE